MSFPVADLRGRFPALARAGRFIFFDNAAGAQIPDTVLAAVTDHLLSRNVQRGGPYRQSREVDAMIARARESVASFVNARGPDEIAFGLNATSFIRAISLAIGQALGSRNEIIVSELDHESNIATWQALQGLSRRSAGANAEAQIVRWPVRDDGRLHTEDLEPLLTDRTRLVACTMASNATGSIVDVAAVARLAHAAGAEVFVDAVHYAPHGSIDVQALDCDFLVCSGYKVFAPHMGFACCCRESINRLPTFREDFIPDVTPDKLEAGTYVYENVAGMTAAVAYLAELGTHVGAGRSAGPGADTSVRPYVESAMAAIADYERTLSAALLDAAESIEGLTVHGVTDRARLHERVPTLCFSVADVDSSAIAEGLAARDVGARSGHMYTPRLMARLGRAPGGVVRVSLVHYNSVEEISRFREALTSVVHACRAQPTRA